MPNVSLETASELIALDGLEVHLENFEGGYTVCFESHTADVDLAPLFRGLPDDRCQFPRWGYVVAGVVEFRFADRTERYEAGDAYYVPPWAHPGSPRRCQDRRVQSHRLARGSHRCCHVEPPVGNLKSVCLLAVPR